MSFSHRSGDSKFSTFLTILFYQRIGKDILGFSWILQETDSGTRETKLGITEHKHPVFTQDLETLILYLLQCLKLFTRIGFLVEQTRWVTPIVPWGLVEGKELWLIKHVFTHDLVHRFYL